MNHYFYVQCLVTQSCPTRCDPMDCSLPGTSVHGDSPGKNTGVGRHAFLQGIFPTQGSNPGLPHGKGILYHLSHQRSPRILEWVAYPFRGSSRPRSQTGLFCIAGGFFTAEPSGKECISHEYLKISYVFTTEYMQFYFFCFRLLFLSTAMSSG